LGVRISASEWLEHTSQESWTLPQSLHFATELKSRGCDWIDASSGGISPEQKIALGPAYQAHFAQAIREATGLPTMAVGLITEPQQAEEIIASGQADMVALGRGMLWDPRWVWHAAAELGGEVAPPPQYGRAAPRAHAQLFSRVPFGMR
jgi:2,4-dienoyl-CoA reductase-like NADH-dependent reductase (Old Yellow Enzyme family)